MAAAAKVVRRIVGPVEVDPALDAHSGAIGDYPEGLVVTQDDQNEGMSQNFRLVDWRTVRAALGL